MIKKLTLIIAFFSFVSYYGQTKSIDTIDLKGNWTFCTLSKLDTSYFCKKGWSTFEFKDNGRFRETQGRSNWTGTYSLTGNIFTHKRNPKYGCTAGSIIENIIWINANRFYSQGQEGPGGPTVYTFWQRH
jgi:hypothetical protein